MQKLGKCAFGYDPLIGCPFDDSEMRVVPQSGEYRLRDMVSFLGRNKSGTSDKPVIRGKIVAIGENAKYLNGDAFTILAIQVGGNVYYKHSTDLI